MIRPFWVHHLHDALCVPATAPRRHGCVLPDLPVATAGTAARKDDVAPNSGGHSHPAKSVVEKSTPHSHVPAKRIPHPPDIRAKGRSSRRLRHPAVPDRTSLSAVSVACREPSATSRGRGRLAVSQSPRPPRRQPPSSSGSCANEWVGPSGRRLEHHPPRPISDSPPPSLEALQSRRPISTHGREYGACGGSSLRGLTHGGVLRARGARRLTQSHRPGVPHMPLHAAHGCPGRRRRWQQEGRFVPFSVGAPRG